MTARPEHPLEMKTLPTRIVILSAMNEMQATILAYKLDKD
jgi:hypothetical protein